MGRERLQDVVPAEAGEGGVGCVRYLGGRPVRPAAAIATCQRRLAQHGASTAAAAGPSSVSNVVSVVGCTIHPRARRCMTVSGACYAHIATTGRGRVRPMVVLRARRVVTPDGERAADVVVDGELIHDVAPYGTATGDVVSVADDRVLLPGLVDSHVHVNEPGRTEWEGFATATARGRRRRRHHARRHAAQQHPADGRRRRRWP